MLLQRSSKEETNVSKDFRADFIGASVEKSTPAERRTSNGGREHPARRRVWYFSMDSGFSDVSLEWRVSAAERLSG